MTDQDCFMRIPGMSTFAYVAGNVLASIYEKGKTINEIGEVRIGMGTGNNDLFLQLWWEVHDKAIDYSIHDVSELIHTKKKYFPIAKAVNERDGMVIMSMYVVRS